MDSIIHFNELPRSRLNVITFDRIRQLDLTKEWSKNATRTPIATVGDSSSHSSNIPQLAHPIPRARAMDVHTVEHFLSAEECKSLISRSRSQDSLSGEYLPSDRDATRLIVRSPELAKVLWHRLLSVLPDILLAHTSPLIPMGFGTSGQWIPYGVNPCMRFSDYHPGSRGFAPHRDAAFVQSTCERSIFTLLIYLNGIDDFANDSLLPDRGCTSFYQPTKQCNSPYGIRVQEELPERYFEITPQTRRAIVFPQDVLHGGDPIAAHASGIKTVLRTDILFRRNDVVPAAPLDMNWRSSPEYLLAVDLFQRAFKYELDGQIERASDCYERCTSLRVAELHRKQIAERNRTQQLYACGSESSDRIKSLDHHHLPSTEASCLATSVIPDCLRIVFSFLQDYELRNAYQSCRMWWRAQYNRYNQKGHTAVVTNLITAMPIDAVFPMKSVYRSGFSVSETFSKCCPYLHTINGITCEMSYPKAFYRLHPEACIRALAVYGAILFSHRLPNAIIEDLPTTFDPPDQPRLRKNVAYQTHLSCANTKDPLQEELRRTRIVLSYESLVGEVEWCTFEQIIVAAFRGQEFEVQYGTRNQFNEPDRRETSESARASSSHGVSGTSPENQTRVKSFLYGQKKHRILDAKFDIRSRFTVSFAGLLPMNYYHAGVRVGNEELRLQRLRLKKEKELQANDELRCLDQSTIRKKWQDAIGRDATERLFGTEGWVSDASDGASSAVLSANVPPSCLGLTTVRVHEIRNARQRKYFRVSFIGIPAL